MLRFGCGPSGGVHAGKMHCRKFGLYIRNGSFDSKKFDFLKKAKEKRYFVRCIYVLTVNPDINVSRVKSREQAGGHGVPEEKIRTRYDKALALLPELVPVCDVLHIYDNSDVPFRIFKNEKSNISIGKTNFGQKIKLND